MVPPHEDFDRDNVVGHDGEAAVADRPKPNGTARNIDRFSAGWPPAYDQPTSEVVPRPDVRWEGAPQEGDGEALAGLPSVYRDRPYLTVGDVALLLGVTTQTVRNWSDAGRLSPIRTPGGHRRFPTIDVARLVARLGA